MRCHWAIFLVPLLDRPRSSSALQTIEAEATASPRTPKQWHKTPIDVVTGPYFLCHCLTVFGQAVLFKRWKQKTLLLRGLRSRRHCFSEDSEAVAQKTHCVGTGPDFFGWFQLTQAASSFQNPRTDAAYLATILPGCCVAALMPEGIAT